MAEVESVPPPDRTWIEMETVSDGPWPWVGLAIGPLYAGLILFMVLMFRA